MLLAARSWWGFASIRELGAAPAGYFEDDLKPEGQASTRTFWWGAPCEDLGLRQGAPVRWEAFEALSNNQSPLTSEALVQRQMGKRLKRGTEVVLGAPKSVSVLLAAGSERVRGLIQEASVAAVRSTLEYMDSLTPRNRGKGGRVKDYDAKGVFAVFQHRVNRLSEPHLHFHCCTFHLGLSRDGSWGRLERRVLYDRLKDIGARFRGELALELESRGFGLESTTSASGKLDSFRVRGVPIRVERAFSKRSSDIERALASSGWESARAASYRALETRGEKEGLREDELRARVRATCLSLGFNPEALEVSSQVSPRRAGAELPLDPSSSTRRSPQRESTHVATRGDQLSGGGDQGVRLGQRVRLRRARWLTLHSGESRFTRSLGRILRGRRYMAAWADETGVVIGTRVTRRLGPLWTRRDVLVELDRPGKRGWLRVPFRRVVAVPEGELSRWVAPELVPARPEHITRSTTRSPGRGDRATNSSQQQAGWTRGW